MLLINYCKTGIAYADFEIFTEVERWISVNKRWSLNSPETDVRLDVSAQNIVYAFKLAIINDQITKDQIKIFCNGVDMEVDEFGAFHVIPKEFDLICGLLRDVVSGGCKKRISKDMLSDSWEEAERIVGLI